MKRGGEFFVDPLNLYHEDPYTESTGHPQVTEKFEN